MKRNAIALFALAGMFALHAVPAYPQVVPQSSQLGSYKELAVTASSARVQLGASVTAFGSITIYNAGTKDVFFKRGGSTVTAATTDTRIPAGKHITLSTSDAYLAGICAGSDSSTLYIYQGSGPFYFG